MLELRPNCELCDCDLKPDSPVAMICTYECTFCQNCVDQVLRNVCPNCGGGFYPRPIRPQTSRRAGVGLAHQPASEERVLSKYTRAEIELFADQFEDVSPELR